MRSQAPDFKKNQTYPGGRFVKFIHGSGLSLLWSFLCKPICSRTAQAALRSEAGPSDPGPSETGPSEPGPSDLWVLSRRVRCFGHDSTLCVQRSAFNQRNKKLTHNYVPMQSAWVQYTRQVSNLCTTDFWCLFETLRDKPGTHVESVLKQVFGLCARCGTC